MPSSQATFNRISFIFLFDFQQCIYLNTPATFWPSLLHGVVIQTGCQVIEIPSYLGWIAANCFDQLNT